MAVIAIVATSGLVVVMAGTAAAKTTRHLNLTFTGAPIGAHENVYAVRGPGFRGATVQFVKINAKGTAGTDTTTTYDRFGSVDTVDTFTIASNAPGIVSIKGSGHYVGGTARYKHARGHYTFSGTENLSTHLITVHLTGTEVF
jgi:hypothetical protein